MLPDLWRMAHRHVRPARGVVAPLESPLPRLGEVLAGVRHHERADGAFHASESFRDGEQAMARALATIEAPRLPLFGHIAWELCLDGALVRREGAPLLAQVRDAIASALEPSAGESAVDAAARIHHTARKGEALPPEVNARVGHMLAELARGFWIEGYAHGEIVAERLGGIRARLGFPPLEEEPRRALAALLEERIERAGAAIEPLLGMAV
jgi:hypothetical protein